MEMTGTRSRILLALFCLICSSQSWSADKRIGIIVFDGVLTSDITAPIEVFGIASRKSWFSDYETITINVGESDTITTEEGLKLKVDAYLRDRPAVDVLLLPSSYNMGPLLENEALISYIRQTSTKAEWMASNCSGARLLAEAGVLDGRNATTWAGGEADMADDYPKVKVQYNRNYVIDGNVLTSNGSVVSYEAALALLSRLSSQDKADEVKSALQMQRVWKD
ncbi:transcriptional regulator [Hahella sp. CCB-MM4]|uniref:DJ-1/PfpI family protein n=1 Tax=Hahella sp. (strain CCB-MM4) TaxID=1926491 RepID=UPI000B9B3BB7|nr:DJ-1/PfpI family protein [Hahella sp. CCB-MM4]OZG74553.1 transcriptional regulator [Hahella sp. CCB-MM4]